MRKSLFLIIAGVAIGGSVLPAAASAATASECVERQRDLNKEGQALQKDYAALQELAEQAEHIGDDYAAAKEESGLGDGETAARASALGEEFQTLKARVAKKNDDLMQRSDAFNKAQRAFNSACSAYMKR